MAKVTVAPAYVPQLLVAPTPRCFHREGSSRGSACGAVATWERSGRDWFSTQYFCDVHRDLNDQAIAREHVFRVVSLNVEVLLAAVDINAPFAQTEALARLKAAVERVGGLVDVHDVGSRVVKSYAPGRRGKGSDASGDAG